MWYILTRFYFFINFDTNSLYYGVVLYILRNNLSQKHPTMGLFFGAGWGENENCPLSILLFETISDKVVSFFHIFDQKKKMHILGLDLLSYSGFPYQFFFFFFSNLIQIHSSIVLSFFFSLFCAF